MIDKVSAWLTRLFEQYKLVRRIWAIGLFLMIVVVTTVVFSQLPMVTAPVASAYGTLCGLVAIVFKFYADSRDKD